MEMMCEEGRQVVLGNMWENNSKSEKLEQKKKPIIIMNSNSNSNNPTPTATPASPVGQKKKKKKKGGGGNSGGGVEESSEEQEVHIWTERERRKKMRTMFSTLHSLLPHIHLPPKADKSTIVDEAIKYIDLLQSNLQQLQKQMHDKYYCKNTPIIDLDPPILSTTRTPQRQANEGPSSQQNMPRSYSLPTLGPPLSEACFQTWFSPNVVINMCGNDAQISVCSTRKPGFLSTLFYILDKHKIEVVSAHICSNPYRCMYMIHAHAEGGAPDRFSEGFSVEETFKLAVGEVIFCLLSC